MRRSIRNWRENALLVPILFLAGALLLAGALAVQALRAARAHQVVAKHALRDYSAFAAWDFARRAEAGVARTIGLMLAPAERIEPLSPRGAVPGPGILTDSAARAACGCGAGPVLRTVFSADSPAAGRLVTAGEPLDGEGASSLLRELQRSFSAPAEAGPTRPSFVVPLSGTRLVAYRVLRDSTGRPARAYGFVADAAPVLRPIFERVMRGPPLLPPALTGTAPNDSVLITGVATYSGVPVYRSSGGEPGAPLAVELIGGHGSGLLAEARLRPPLEARLLAARSTGRPGMLLSLFGLSGGMILMALYHLRRAMHLTAMQSRFVTSVSHELRTPLAQIRMFAETLGYERERSAEERRRFVAVLHREAVRLSELVENVLQFARLDQRKERLAFAAVDLREEAHTAIESLAPIAAAKGASCVNSVPPGTRVWADRGAVRRIILNLLDNALKYGPEGQRVEVSSEARVGRVLLRVDDQGPGVAAGSRETIFGAFERLNAGPSAPTGSGIGLAIVRELAGALGGTVHLEDGPDGGARFVVTLLDAPA